jgi:hypothetical protein
MIFRSLDFADQAQADLLGNDKFRENRTGATQFFKDELLGVSMEDFKRSLVEQSEKEMELQREQIRQQRQMNLRLGNLPAVQGL